MNINSNSIPTTQLLVIVVQELGLQVSMFSLIYLINIDAFALHLFQNVENIIILSTTDMLLLQRVGDIALKIAVVFQYSVCIMTCYQSQSVFLSQGVQGMPVTFRLLTRVSCLMRIAQNSVSLSSK